MAVKLSALERRTNTGLPEASTTIRRPSSSICLTTRIWPTVSASRCSTSTSFSLSTTVEPAARRDALTFAATGTIMRRVPEITSALACCTPSSSVWVESILTIVAKVSGGCASCASCDLALVSSLPARFRASASAWFLAISRSFNSARFSASPISAFTPPIGTIRTLMRAWRYSPCCAFLLRTTVRTFFTANHTMTTTTATMTTSSNTPSAP